MKVLVIDDDPFTLDLIAAMLNGKYIVSASTSAGDGLKLAKDNDADLILLNWLLPGKTGAELLAELKSDSAAKDIPVIVISGKVEPDFVEDVIESGAAEFVQKPFSKNELVEKIRLALGS